MGQTDTQAQAQALPADDPMRAGGAGVDYGHGLVNLDTTTGIRYGVISQHSLGEFWPESVENDYGAPTCGCCGAPAVAIADVPETVDTDAADWTQAPHECADFACLACRRTFGSESAYSDEAIGFGSTDPDYDLCACLDSDVMITRAPYYTRARFCSPCVPGAGNLDNPDPDGARAYCLGPDWFDEDRPCPYPVYRTDTGACIYTPPAPAVDEE